MDIETKGNSYKKEQRRAKECYANTGRPWCPKLNAYVAFNAMGFRHLMRKGGAQRAKKEQIRRFNLLPYAKSIITNPNAIFISEERTITQPKKWRKKKIAAISKATFFACTNRIDDKQITVIIRQINGGQKHFFSIFADDI